MNEATEKAKLIAACKELMPGCKVLRHEDMFRAGVPDMTVTWRGFTTWWECKVAWEGKEPTGKTGQKATCFQLGTQGVCYYVIFTVSKIGNSGIMKTEIVHPGVVLRDTWPYTPVKSWPGLRQREVAEFIRSKHLGLGGTQE